MTDEFRAQSLLRSLGDFSDPAGAAAQVQADALMDELRRSAAIDPNRKVRLTEEGPEQTLAEILAEIDEEERMIEALREAIGKAKNA